MHYKKELKYLNAVAKMLNEQGYKVEVDPKNRDLLDVWGRCITMKIITVKGSEFGENAPRVNRITITGDNYVMWKD